MTEILNLEGKPLRDFSNPDRKVKWSKKDVYGDWVFGSLRTIAHLDQTSNQAERRLGHGIEVLQGAYNTDVSASAGTHDFDACLDVFIPQEDWLDAQRFLRARGWAAWWRYPPSFGNHIHMISLGYTARVGSLVPGQVSDYYNHKTGLAGHAADNTWHPDNIDSTIFDFRQWKQDTEDNMPLQAEDKQFIDAKIDGLRQALDGKIDNVKARVDSATEEIVQAVLGAPVATDDAGNPVSLKKALRKVYKGTAEDTDPVV